MKLPGGDNAIVPLQKLSDYLLMMRELDLVSLLKDIPERGLQSGDVGTVVYCYQDGAAVEVEFVTAAGNTLGVLTLGFADVQPMHGRQILHVRELASA